MDAKAQKRDDIARAARELFGDFGYRSVSMDQIAARANVAKGTLYLYFKDKEDLFLYLVDEFLNNMREFVESVESRNLALTDELHEIIFSLLRYRREQKFLFRVMREAQDFKTPAAVRVEQTIDDVILTYIEDRLNRAMEQKMIRTCRSDVLSFVVLKVYNALAFEWEERHEPLDEKGIAEMAGLFLKEGLLLRNEEV